MRYRALTLVCIALLAALGLAYWAGSQVTGLRVVSTFPANGGETGAFGPVEIRFDRPVEKRSLPGLFRLEPELPGRWEWDGQTAWFFPQPGLAPGSEYTAHLDPGVVSQQGEVSRQGATWKFRVRPAEILYLSPVRGPRELWRVSLDGTPPVQVTSTGGKVVDYAPSRGGASIAVAIQNDAGGIDLWIMDREGGGAGLLASCGADSCRQPAWSPDGSFIAYSRKSVQTDPRSQIWTVDLKTRQAAPLYSSARVGGQDPSWSPDGKRLAFYDPGQSGLRVRDLASGSETVIQTAQAGTASWSPGGNQLGYNDLQGSGVFPHTAALAYDFERRKASDLFGQEDEAAEYSLPEWSPDGAWLVAGSHLAGGSPAQQLYLYRAGSRTPVEAITADLLYTNGAYHWDPSGKVLLFQRARLGGADVRPDVVVWDRGSREIRVLAKDAGQPAWLP